MILMLLQAAQQTPALAKQVAPNLYVTVEQPGGMPEWVKILITAAAGAFIGIFSSILMEFLRPYIAKAVVKKTMAAQLSAELRRNLRLIEAGYKWLQSVEGKDRIVIAQVLHKARLIPQLIKDDRFMLFATTQKAVMYEYDPEGNLERFYKLTKRLVQLAKVNADLSRFEEALGLATIEGQNFVASQKLRYHPTAVTQKEVTQMHEDTLETQSD